jgi:acyl-CoA synthetase (NDP forming)/RimJ/RimL family protein N-acetyltransferase
VPEAPDRLYPASWEADVALRDGGTAHLRPILPTDADAVQRFHAGQSEESIYLRFFAPISRLSAADLHRFTHVDHRDRVGFVVTLGTEIIGIGRYERIDGDTAEVAFNISDAHQGRGLGTVLLEHLAVAARENGIRRFVADVLPQNQRMLHVFREAGYAVTSAYEDGVVSLHFGLDPTDESVAVMRAREHRAEALSVQALLNPSSVVVIGASRRAGTLGHRLLQDLIAADFSGDLHIVHPQADHVLGVPAVPVLDDIPTRVDLAVIAVPADAVLDVVADCARVGVRGLVVLSRGFAETGGEGLDRQRRLVRLARANGMRVVGPNSWGVINTDPEVRLNASLAAELPLRGRLGLFSQSGAISHVVLAEAARRRVGVSGFLSAGNRADVSGNDCLQYWEEDPATDAVGMYLESIGNPRKFSRIVRRLARHKPVIVLKSGMSGFGVPPGHAVRASLAPRKALDTMLRQSGAIRVENVQQLFDVARFVLHQPLPAGPGVAVVGNSDALAALLADACSSWDLQLVDRPLTLPPETGAEQLAQAVATAAAADGVHAVAVAYLPPVESTQRTAFEPPPGIPVVICSPDPVGQDPDAENVPLYPTPEEAVRALAAAVRYGIWRQRDPGRRVDPQPRDPARARLLAGKWLAGQPAGVTLAAEQVVELLDCYGIAVWASVPVSGPDSAVQAAEQLGWPVAVKTTAEHLEQRIDLGGVRLDLNGPDELRTAVTQMHQRLAPLGAGDLVLQRMAPPGVGCLLRTVEDPLFGPVVSFAVGGDAADLLGDLAHRIPPLTDVDVADLIRSVRAAPKLFGYRGARPVDVAALEDLIARVSCLADDLPQLAWLELDPVSVGESGLAVLAAGARLAHAVERADTGRRELPES